MLRRTERKSAKNREDSESAPKARTLRSSEAPKPSTKALYRYYKYINIFMYICAPTGPICAYDDSYGPFPLSARGARPRSEPSRSSRTFSHFSLRSSKHSARARLGQMHFDTSRPPWSKPIRSSPLEPNALWSFNAIARSPSARARSSRGTG